VPRESELTSTTETGTSLLPRSTGSIDLDIGRSTVISPKGEVEVGSSGTQLPEQTQYRTSRRVNYLSIGLTAALFVLVALDGVAMVIDRPFFRAIQRQVDITTGGNLASFFIAGLLALIGLFAAIIASTAHPKLVMSGWALISAGSAGLAVSELLGLRAIIPEVTILVPVVALLLFAFLFVQLRHMPGARTFLIVGFLLIVSNPTTEYAKQEIVSNPGNYSFVAADKPYRMNDDAWTKLQGVALIQEITEIGGLICLVAALGIARDARLGKSRRIGNPLSTSTRSDTGQPQHELGDAD
jgi:hypothetical protein